MNKYLSQISINSSMVKQAKKDDHEIRDTAIIGGVGTASSLVTNHIQDKLGLNGIKQKALGKATPMLDRLKSTMKDPAKTIGATLKSTGFKRGLKIGAIGGAIGLAGDYAAVKINNRLEKKSMDNKYLEKVAEMYSVKGHPGIGSGMYKTPNLQLNRDEYHDYSNRVKSHPVQHLPLGLMVGAGGAAAYRAHTHGGRPLMAGLIAGAAGGFVGRRIADRVAHNKALEGMKIVHPMILNQD